MPLLEDRLLQELAALRRRIAELQAEQAILERMIVRIRRENLGIQEATRSTSTGRVLVESNILNALRGAKGFPLSNDTLKQIAQRASIGLKDSTFRSHLNRLKLRGLIETAGHGLWKASKTTLDQPVPEVSNT